MSMALPTSRRRRTISVGQLAARVRAESCHEPTDHARPATRGECAEGPRPCPFVGCRHNLYLEVTFAGSLTVVHPGREPWEMPPGESCALDLAEVGPHKLQTIGDVLNLTRERARMIVREAAGQLDDKVLREHYDPGGDPLRVTFGEALEERAETGHLRKPMRPQDQAARAEARIDAWANEVLALMRSGVGLREAWAIANEGERTT